MRGMITNINYGRGCGFIQPDETTVAREVYFEQDAVIGTPFKELYFGEAVTFELQEEVSDPAQLRAATVARAGE